MISLRTKLNESKAIIFPTVILYIFLIFAHLWWFGGFELGAFGLVFSVDGVLGLRLSI